MIESVHLRLDSSHPRDTSWNCAPAHPRMMLRCDSRTRATTLERANQVLQRWDDPLSALDWMETSIRGQFAKGGARWVGYLSYDLIRAFEQLPSLCRDDLNLPLFVFALVPDNPNTKATTGPDRKIAPVPVFDPAGADGESSFAVSRGGRENSSRPCFSPESTFSRDEYLGTVARVIEYIRAGDVFQVNLSQRFSAALDSPAAEVYQRLLTNTPAWYGAYLNFSDHALVCNSPELFLRVTPDPESGQRRIVTRPIKGTRPRRPGMETELRQSAKDQAELNMIVDLERNDLGRVCEIGSIKVTEPRVIEAHPTVYHGAATIEGILRDDVAFVDLLRATFPGGSITGAPKIRAMQIIEELEPIRRGPYCGAIGYLASDGTIQFNIAIRTMIVKNNRVHIPVGGGIVADSDPQREYDETLVKAQAMFRALGIA